MTFPSPQKTHTKARQARRQASKADRQNRHTDIQRQTGRHGGRQAGNTGTQAYKDKQTMQAGNTGTQTYKGRQARQARRQAGRQEGTQTYKDRQIMQTGNISTQTYKGRQTRKLALRHTGMVDRQTPWYRGKADRHTSRPEGKREIK